MHFDPRIHLADAAWIRPAFLSKRITKLKEHLIFPRHQHHNYELIFVEHGTYVARLNEKVVTLRRHQALIVKPGDSHEDSCSPPLRYRAINFDLSSSLTPGSEKGTGSFFAESVRVEDQIFRADPKLFGELFRKLEAHTNEDDFISQLILDAILREIFWRVMDALRPDCLSPLFRQSSSQKSFILRLTQLFEARLSHSLSVVEMARELQMGQRKFEQNCHQVLQDSPARCFARFKIDRATALLKQTDMLVKEISDYLGFQDSNHFSRVFHRFAGCPPSSIKRGKKSGCAKPRNPASD